jgi:precorrin-6B methylase 2
MDSIQNFAAQEFEVLINYFISRGYTFVDGVEQGINPVKKTVSFRYDIHHRDLYCGYGFLSQHTSDIPATFYLLFDYSKHEREHRNDFDLFAGKVRSSWENIKLGFHDSPVDNYLIEEFADGHSPKYRKWLRSEKCIRFFSQLYEAPMILQALHTKVEERFIANVTRMRERYGSLNSMASHGGQLSQILRPQVAALGEVGYLISSLFSENWINADRLHRAELLADIEKFKRLNPLRVNVTEAGGKIVAMIKNIKRFVSEEKAINILIHPATWGKDIRDGEISTLLAAVNMSISAPSRKAGFMTTEPFDLQYGTDTAGTVRLRDLEIDSPNIIFGQSYQPTHRKVLPAALKFLNLNVQNFDFVDLGCGKGRMVLIAALSGFRNSIGVEFATELVEIANDNAKIFGLLNLKIVCQDAADFKFPGGDLIIFMYNPFLDKVMSQVIANLEQQRSGKVYLIYRYPKCRDVLLKFPFLQYIGEVPGWEGDRGVHVWVTN